MNKIRKWSREHGGKWPLLCFKCGERIDGNAYFLGTTEPYDVVHFHPKCFTNNPRPRYDFDADDEPDYNADESTRIKKLI